VNEALAPFKDGHTRYTPPEQIRADALASAQGLTGIGMSLIRGAGEYAVVITVFPGGPAERAGIAGHDRILAIDGRPASGSRALEASPATSPSCAPRYRPMPISPVMRGPHTAR
jgi:C-terminal processing protease CtpA/Prc